MNFILDKKALLLSAELLFFASTAAAQTCHYDSLEPGAGKVVNNGVIIDFGQGDEGEQSDSWLGPIVIARLNGASCSIDPNVGIVERPIYVNEKILLLTTYSGSIRIVYAVDTRTCNILWKSREFSGPVILRGNLLHMENKSVQLAHNCLP